MGAGRFVLAVGSLEIVHRLTIAPLTSGFSKQLPSINNGPAKGAKKSQGNMPVRVYYEVLMSELWWNGA